MTPERWQQIERIYHAALARDERERAVAVAPDGRFLMSAVVEAPTVPPDLRSTVWMSPGQAPMPKCGSA